MKFLKKIRLQHVAEAFAWYELAMSVYFTWQGNEAAAGIALAKSIGFGAWSGVLDLKYRNKKEK
jgi:hypothetical protein